MVVTFKSSSALVPALTASLAQLPPAMVETQKKIQALVDTTTEALTRAEERNAKLEAELIAARAQHAADKAAAEAQAKAQQKQIELLLTTQTALLGRIDRLEERGKTAETSLLALIKRYNTHAHSYACEGNGLGTAHTSSPGLRRYAGRAGCSFESHTVPEPKFDEEKGKA